MSGSVYAPWARVTDPLKYAIELGQYFNCSIPDDLNKHHDKITDCLRNIPTDNLLNAKVSIKYHNIACSIIRLSNMYNVAQFFLIWFLFRLRFPLSN